MWYVRIYKGKLIPVALAALLAAQRLPAHAATPDTYIGPNQGLWSDPDNWTAGVPNSSAIDVFLTDPSGLTTVLDQSETIDDLTVGAGNVLEIDPFETLTLGGPTLTNSGTIILNWTESLEYNQHAGQFPVTLTCRGTVVLSGTSSGVIAVGIGSRVSDNTIIGQGYFGVGVTNNGTISATTGTLTLAGGLTNNGLLSVAGGTVLLAGPVDNTHGVIEAANREILLFPGGPIDPLMGGTLAGTAAGTINGGSGSTADVSSLQGNVTLAGNITFGTAALSISGSPTIVGTVGLGSI